MAADEKPSVLIIGGLGYIGRFLALYIHKNNLASEVRLVDKVLPQLAWLAPEFSEACSTSKFMQADASREQSLPRIFNRPNGKQWDYVFNCAGETRHSQEEELYKLRCLELSVNIGKEAARRGIKCFVEISTGQVYKPDLPARKEQDKMKPWSKMAVYKLKAEEALAKIDGLNLVIVRLACVYGPYTLDWIGTALCIGRVFQSRTEDLKLLGTRDVRQHTVHIDDVTRALWEVVLWCQKGKPRWNEATMGRVPTFNVVDNNDTQRGQLADIVGKMFNIRTGFYGSLASMIARTHLDRIVEDTNDDLLGPWADLLEDASIQRPGPLTPYMDKEHLKDTHLNIDGTRFRQVVGFEYEKSKLTSELVEEIVDSYRRMNWWP